MTNSRVTLRSVLLGLALGLLCCWWMLRPGTTAPPQREVASAPGATSGDARPSWQRTQETPADDKSDAGTDDEAPDAPAKPPGRLVVHVVAEEDGRSLVGAHVRRLWGGDDTPVVANSNGDAACDVPAANELDANDHEWLEVSAPGRVRQDVSVRVASGAELRRDVSLRRGIVVEGVVRGVNGAAIAGALVVAQEGGYCCAQPEVARATGGDDGRFRLDGIPPGSPIHYEVSAPRHVLARRFRGKNDASPLDVTLDPAGRIRGVVRSPDGKPAAHATVCASSEPDGSQTSDFTGDDGRFVVDGLELDREWKVTASKDDCMDSAESAPIRLDAERAEAPCDLVLRPIAELNVEFEFAEAHEPSVAKLHSRAGGGSCAVPGKATFVVRSPGAWRVDADVQGLARGSAETEIGPGETKTLKIRFEQGASIAGTVVDDVGSPIADAVVNVDEGEDWTQQGVAGADGVFRVKGLLPGKHAIAAHARVHGDVEVKDVAAPADGLRVVLPRYGRARFRLVLPAGDPSPATQRIHWNNYPDCPEDDGPWTGVEYSRDLAPAEWLLEIQVAGYVRFQRRIVVTAATTTDLGDIPLSAGLPLRGRVVDAEGKGVPDASVYLRPDLLVHCDSDEQGDFVAEHAPDGDLVLSVSADGFVEAEVPYSLTKDAPPLVVKLARMARLRVSIVGASRETLAGLFVRLYDGDEAISDVCEPDGSGVVTLQARAGKWRVSVRKQEDDVEVASRDVDLTGGKDQSVEIALPK